MSPAAMKAGTSNSKIATKQLRSANSAQSDEKECSAAATSAATSAAASARRIPKNALVSIQWALYQDAKSTKTVIKYEESPQSLCV